MAFNGRGKIALPVGNCKVVDITDEVIKVLQRSLSEARSAIEAGGSWSPLSNVTDQRGLS